MRLLNLESALDYSNIDELLGIRLIPDALKNAEPQQFALGAMQQQAQMQQFRWYPNTLSDQDRRLIEAMRVPDPLIHGQAGTKQQEEDLGRCQSTFKGYVHKARPWSSPPESRLEHPIPPPKPKSRQNALKRLWGRIHKWIMRDKPFVKDTWWTRWRHSRRQHRA